MTNQEILDIVMAHLWSMKERSMFNGECAYRGKNGSKCAIGILIPDKVYTVEIEGLSIYAFPHKWPMICSLFDKSQINFLTSLQGIHDDKTNWGKNGLYVKVNRKFASLAKEYKLTYTPFKRPKV